MSEEELPTLTCHEVKDFYHHMFTVQSDLVTVTVETKSDGEHYVSVIPKIGAVNVEGIGYYTGPDRETWHLRFRAPD